MSIKKNVFRFQITIDDIFFMEMFDRKTEFSCIKFGFFLRKSYLSGKMETQISAWAIVKGKVKIVRSLESKMEINDELMIGLLENVGLDNGVFELFLEDEVFLFESLQSI